jgi:hypothetical protein
MALKQASHSCAGLRGNDSCFSTKCDSSLAADFETPACREFILTANRGAIISIDYTSLFFCSAR